MIADGIAVWGSHGYLGSQVVKRFQPRMPVARLGRSELPIPGRACVDASFPTDYKSSSVTGAYLRTVEERCRWSTRKGCRYVYIASMSSLPPVASVYGAVKRAAEEIVLVEGHRLVRAGLIVSQENPGGRFAQLAGIVRAIPVVPVPSPTHFRLFVNDLADVMACIESAVDSEDEPIADLPVPGMRDASLAEVLEMLVEPGQRVIRLGPRSSAVAARVAASLHMGRLDSLASIARATRPRSPSEGLDRDAQERTARRFDGREP